MNRKETYVYNVFQNIAGGYDRANRRISAGSHLKWKKEAVRRLCRTLGQSPSILDIGCGTGDMLKLIYEARPDAKLTGLDFSPNMLKEAKKNCHDIPELSLIRGNAMSLPLKDSSFDGISISFALRNTADYEAVIKEAFRVLKPGGRFVCIDSFVPENHLIRPFYQLYFSVMMPLIGGGFKNQKEYRWLEKSTSQFISPEELMHIFKISGYGNIAYKKFMFGASVCVSGDKI